MGLIGLKSSVDGTAFFPEAVGRRLCPCLVHPLQAARTPWLAAPPPSLKPVVQGPPVSLTLLPSSRLLL